MGDISQIQTVVKEPGMKYFKYFYRIKCPVKSIALGFVAIGYAFMCVFFLVMGGGAAVGTALVTLLIALLAGSEAVIGFMTVATFRRCKKQKAYTPFLYKMTLAFMFGGGIAWFGILGAYMGMLLWQQEEGPVRWIVSLVLWAVIAHIPVLLRYRYFRRRRGVYGLPSEKQAGVAEPNDITDGGKTI